ncbi:hypothetical protein D3C86_1051270 [compost metagenome]
MGRLRVQVVLEAEGLPVEAVLLIADVADDAADRVLDLLLDAGSPVALRVHDALAADFAGQHHQIGRRQGLARHARLGVLGQEQIDDGVGDLVRDLVGVAFRDALGREEEGRTGQGRLLQDGEADRHIKICLYVQVMTEAYRGIIWTRRRATVACGARLPGAAAQGTPSTPGGLWRRPRTSAEFGDPFLQGGRRLGPPLPPRHGPGPDYRRR